MAVNGDLGHLLGVLRLDREKCRRRWLDRLEHAFGEYLVVSMDHGRGKGIVCQMNVDKGSRKYLRKADGPKAQELMESLCPLLSYEPNPKFSVKWDPEKKMWVSQVGV